jgi:DNA-binding IclR family transcriptional regulator
MRQKSYSPVKTIQKAFRLLEVLADKQPAKPSTLVQELRLPRSNIYRLLATLQEMGYVEKDSGSRYRLGFKMFAIGNTVREVNQLSEIARPYMGRLAEISQENVNLAIMYDQRVLYIDKIESQHYLKLDQPIGKTDPLHCTALGKVLLSSLDDLELEVFLKSKNLVPFTKNTITDPEVLEGVIRNVRKQGYAIDLEELSEGIYCIGAPIRDHTNGVVAAISISGPTVRLTKQKIEELKAPLIEATLEVSKKMGCTHFNTSDLA